MSVVLPIEPAGSHFEFKAVVEGINLGFEFKWNDRDELWRMSFFDGSAQPIRYGVPVVLGRPFFGRNLAPMGLPAGVWQAIDTSGNDAPPTIDDLGTRVIVVFTPLSELTS